MTMLQEPEISAGQVHDSLVRRLGDFRRKIYGRLALEGAAWLVAAAVALALATLLLDRTLRLSLVMRHGLMGMAALVLLAIGWKRIVMPLLSRFDALTLATALDRLEEGGRCSMTAAIGTVMELPELLRLPAAPSREMVELAVKRSHHALASYDFGGRLDDRKRNTCIAVIGAAVLLPALFAIAAPRTSRLWAARMLLGSNEPWPQKTYLLVSGLDAGSILVPRGEPFVLRVGARPGSVAPRTVSMRFRQGSAAAVTAGLTAFGPNDFRYEFASVDSDVEAQLMGGDDVFGPFSIRVADRPRVTDLKLITQHPTETQPQTYTFGGGDADLSFLPRTRMELRVAANTPIAEARIKGPATRPAQADLRRIDDRHFAVNWTHEAPVSLQIELTSREARLASVPTAIGIGLKVDRPPRLTLAYSGVKQRVTPRATIPLQVDARDDYGVADVSLSMKTESPDPANAAQLKALTRAVPLYGPMKPATELVVQPAHRLQLEPMKLIAGSLLTVSASAVDDCYVGPQTSQSRSLTFRVVTPEELFREILLRQQAERAKFRKQADEARSIREQLTTLGTAEAATETGRRHRVVQRETTRIAAALAETLTEMRLNALANDEAYGLMEKNILAPLHGLNDELMNPQKELLDRLKFNDLPALSSAQEQQDRILARMEEILKQMSQWDSFVDVLNQLNEIIRMQDQAQQKTKQLRKNESEGVFEK